MTVEMLRTYGDEERRIRYQDYLKEYAMSLVEDPERHREELESAAHFLDELDRMFSLKDAA